MARGQPARRRKPNISGLHNLGSITESPSLSVHSPCHGSSPDSPCPSKASPPPPMAWPISEPFRSASNPSGFSTYVSFSLIDSCIFLLFLYLSYLILSISELPCLHFNLWPLILPSASCSQLSDSIPDSYIVADTVGTPQLDLWGLPLCQVCSLLSVFHVYVMELRTTTVSVCHICLAYPCLRVSLHTSGFVSVLPSWKIKLYIDDPTHTATQKSCLTNSRTNIGSPLVRTVFSFCHSSRTNTNSCNTEWIKCLPPGSSYCYALSRGSLDPDFGFRFGVPESGVGMDGASASRSLCWLCFCVQYLAICGGHIMGHDGKASDWIGGGDDDEQRSSTKEFHSSNVYN